MLARLVLALLFSAAAIPAQPGCVSFMPNYTSPGMYWLTWHQLFADIHYVEFVPFGGGIAALLIVGNHSQHMPAPIRMTSNSCAPRDVILHGWAWSHTPRSAREHSVALMGLVGGVLWSSPLVNLRTEPAGFRYLNARLDAGVDSEFGVMVVDDQGYRVSDPTLSAVLVAPASGSW